MSKRWIKETDRLKEKIVGLGEDVQLRLTQALDSVFRLDKSLAQQIIETDDEIDDKEVELEEDCLKILALHQPVAVDLRFVVAVLKINNDLERIADLAKNIAERALSLSEISLEEEFPEIREMSVITKRMLHSGLNSLINMDLKQAKEVLIEDDEVDERHRNMYPKIEAKINKRPELANEFLQILSLSRYLERIADLTSNIAEDVIYLIDGEIVRHQS